VTLGLPRLRDPHDCCSTNQGNDHWQLLAGQIQHQVRPPAYDNSTNTSSSSSAGSSPNQLAFPGHGTCDCCPARDILANDGACGLCLWCSCTAATAATAATSAAQQTPTMTMPLLPSAPGRCC